MDGMEEEMGGLVGVGACGCGKYSMGGIRKRICVYSLGRTRRFVRVNKTLTRLHHALFIASPARHGHRSLLRAKPLTVCLPMRAQVKLP
jgi:hypothetical protein